MNPNLPRSKPDLPSSSTAAVLGLLLWVSSAAGLRADHPWMTEYQDSRSCTRCHSSAAHEIMATSHWTWSHQTADGQQLGKNHVINNYCIAVPSNEPRCTSCHIGIGYANKSFDFSDATKVDCLVCHDTTGEYKKFPTAAGAPVTGTAREFPVGSGVMWPPVDLLRIAKSVGRTSRATCGACHFFGGGDDAVKHGDMDSTLYHPSRDVDVHMDAAGPNMQCTDCHKTMAHVIPGSRYSKNYADDQMCHNCHTAAPHAKSNPTLDSHTARVACQSCHIPTFSRGNKSTKMLWDWSTAGQKDANGKNIVRKNEWGETVYDTQKGSFVWERDVVPEYVWSDGGATYATLDTPVEPDMTVPINRLHGSITNSRARIFPVKRFAAIQPYDAGAGRLAIPHLFATGASDTTAYWKVFDWNKSLASGMEYVGRSYSGTLGWVKTEMFWVQNHMVAPKEQALACRDCHTPRGRLDFAALGYDASRAGRLQTLAGFELAAIVPGADPTQLRLQWTAAAGSSYQVQVSDDLAHWTDATEGKLSSVNGETLAWTDSRPAGADSTRRFYRVLRLSN